MNPKDMMNCESLDQGISQASLIEDRIIPLYMSPMALQSLGATYLKITEQRGVLRCIDDPGAAQGLWLRCPKCDVPNVHGITLLFDLDSVAEDLKPPGRWSAVGDSIDDLSLLSELPESPCGIKGVVINGKLWWK